MDRIGVYPNPARDQVTLSGIDRDATISILNGVGQTVSQILNMGETTRYSVADLETGTYFIQVISKDQAVTNTLVKF